MQVRERVAQVGGGREHEVGGVVEDLLDLTPVRVVGEDEAAGDALQVQRGREGIRGVERVVDDAVDGLVFYGTAELGGGVEGHEDDIRLREKVPECPPDGRRRIIRCVIAEAQRVGERGTLGKRDLRHGRRERVRAVEEALVSPADDTDHHIEILALEGLRAVEAPVERHIDELAVRVYGQVLEIVEEDAVIEALFVAREIAGHLAVADPVDGGGGGTGA